MNTANRGESSRGGGKNNYSFTLRYTWTSQYMAAHALSFFDLCPMLRRVTCLICVLGPFLGRLGLGWSKRFAVQTWCLHNVRPGIVNLCFSRVVLRRFVLGGCWARLGRTELWRQYLRAKSPNTSTRSSLLVVAHFVFRAACALKGRAQTVAHQAMTRLKWRPDSDVWRGVSGSPVR